MLSIDVVTVNNICIIVLKGNLSKLSALLTKIKSD